MSSVRLRCLKCVAAGSIRMKLTLSAVCQLFTVRLCHTNSRKVCWSTKLRNPVLRPLRSSTPKMTEVAVEEVTAKLDDLDGRWMKLLHHRPARVALVPYRLLNTALYRVWIRPRHLYSRRLGLGP